MLLVALRGLLAHRRRFAGTLLATVLGVAFLSGTLVLSDTLRANFDNLFASSAAGTDVVVRSATTVSAEDARGPATADQGLLSASLADRVSAVDGVAAAVPAVTGYGELVGKDGTAVGGNGPPRQAVSWVDDPTLTPYRLAEGRAPRTGTEVVVNRGAAADGGLSIGDRTTVLTPEPVEVTIVGLATYGDADGFGEVTWVAFPLEAAQRYLTKHPGQASEVLVRAEPGVGAQELTDRVRGVLPAGTEALTGEQARNEARDEVTEGFLAIFTTFLRLFAAVAVVVSAVSIANTFSIVVAQRLRESALLRAVGAARRQVVGALAVEALAVGVLGSALGLAGGIGIAEALKGVFTGFGFALPDAGLVVTGGSMAVSFAVGVVVTVLAGLLPAVRASRVPPLAALRAVDAGRRAPGRIRTGIGVALLVAGGALVVAGSGPYDAGGGAVAVLAGAILTGPAAAAGGARLLGHTLRGPTGELARGNAARDPRRTASSSAALVVGVGVVTLFTVFAASLSASIERDVTRSFGADLVVAAPGFGGGALSPRLARDVATLPEVRKAVGLASGAAIVGGRPSHVTAADPAALADVLDLDVAQGSVAELGGDGLAVSDSTASDRGWSVGTRVPVSYSDGARAALTVRAVYRSTYTVGDLVLPRAAYEAHAAQPVDTRVLVRLQEGTDVAAAKATVQEVAARYGGPDVQDEAGYADAATAGIDTLLGVVYALLALAVLTALSGIASSLSLSVGERVRELGLLRAVGQSRRQARAMVRLESVLVSVLGTAAGLALGVLLGVGLARSVDAGVVAAPAGTLAVVLVAGAVAGVLAAVRPARRAARTDVLQAIATE